MEKRAVKKALEAAQPFLATGEQVGHVSRVRTKPPTHQLKVQNAAAAAAGLAMVGVLGGGMMAFKVPRTFCLLLTERRLLFLDVDAKYARTLSQVAFEIRRDLCRATRVTSFPSGKIRLDSPEGELVTLVYPLGVRLDGTNLLKAMHGPTGG